MNLIHFLLPEGTEAQKDHLARYLAERERMLNALCANCPNRDPQNSQCRLEPGKPQAVRTTCPETHWLTHFVPFHVILPEGLNVEITPGHRELNDPLVSAFRMATWETTRSRTPLEPETGNPATPSEPELLGDRVANFLHKTRLDKLAQAYTQLTGKDCGCKKRQEALNEWDRNRRAKHQDSGNTAAPSENATGPV